MFLAAARGEYSYATEFVLSDSLYSYSDYSVVVVELYAGKDSHAPFFIKLMGDNGLFSQCSFLSLFVLYVGVMRTDEISTKCLY